MTTAVTDSDYARATEDAALVPRPERVAIRIEGTEAGEFLQGQLTNDVEALAPGEGCYAAFLSHKGKMRADCRVLRGEDEFLLDTEHPMPLLRMIETYSLGREVRWTDERAAVAVVSLLGPGSGDRLDRSPPEAEHAHVEGEHGRYVRTDLGVDLICASEAAGSLASTLGVEPAAAAVAECLRVESGRPRLGIDVDEDTIPEEAGLNERAVSFTKGCYVGQETVARLHYRGRPNRHLRGLRLASPAATGDEVVAGERRVGAVGSVCESPRLGTIALALLRREAEPGETVIVGAGRLPAEVVELPFR